MKSFILVALACLTVVSAAPPGGLDSYKKVFDQCNSDPATKISKEVQDQAKRGEKIEYTPQIGAFTFCISNKLGSISDSGDVNVEKLRNSLKRTGLDDEKIEEQVQKCAVKKDTREETAFHMWSCSAEFMRAHRRPRPPKNQV